MNTTLRATIVGQPPRLPPLLDGRAQHRQPLHQPGGRQLGRARRLFGHWAWNGYLFGAPRSGPRDHGDLIDATSPTASPGWRASCRPNTFGGYPDPVLLLDRLQRRRTAPGAWPATTTATRASSLPVHDRQRPERPVLLVGELAVPHPGSPVGRHPPGRAAARRRTPGASPSPTWSCSTRWSRSARTAALIVGRGRPGQWLAAGPADRGVQLPDHRRPPDLGLTIDQRPRGHADAERRPPGRAGALPAARLRAEHRQRQHGHRGPGHRHRHADPVRRVGRRQAAARGLAAGHVPGRQDLGRRRPRPPHRGWGAAPSPGSTGWPVPAGRGPRPWPARSAARRRSRSRCSSRPRSAPPGEVGHLEPGVRERLECDREHARRRRRVGSDSNGRRWPRSVR